MGRASAQRRSGATVRAQGVPLVLVVAGDVVGDPSNLLRHVVTSLREINPDGTETGSAIFIPPHPGAGYPQAIAERGKLIGLVEVDARGRPVTPRREIHFPDKNVNGPAMQAARLRIPLLHLDGVVASLIERGG